MKHRLLTCIFIFFACLAVVGQVNQVWWSKGRVLHVNPVAGIDSVTFGQFVNADTFLIVIDRASRRIVYDTIDEHVPGMVFHDTIHTTHTIYLEPGRRIGVFSVAKDKQVSFSQGNLQYVRNQDVWKFADKQYEYIGAGNVRDGELANRIDLFGWSTDNPVTPWGIKYTSNSNFIGQFVDWGKNCIHNSEANTWRTLSNDEWKYLFQLRKDAANLYAFVSIDTINGIIILPDNWQPIDTISLKMGNNEFDKNKLSWTQWTALEANEAVFLPAAGVLMGTKHNHTTSGLYWSSTADSENDINAYSLYFPKRYINFDYTHQRSTKRSVRLVHDTIVLPPAPEYVDLGLSVKWATFNVGAIAPEDYGNYFAWGEVEPKAEYGWENYKWGDGTASNMTKYNEKDGLTTLELSDDAAHVNWGGKWRMPTMEEAKELYDKCEWNPETRDGIDGYRVVGPNGNSIFIPIAGFNNKDQFGNGLQQANVNAYYWTKTRTSNLQNEAYDLGLNTLQGAYGIVFNTRRLGFPIRAVYDDNVVILTINCTPEDAGVGFHYSGGYHVHGNSVMVKKGASPLYQVAATKEGYLSQGDTLHNITKDTTLNIALKPFSEGTWVKIDNNEFTKVESYYVSKKTGQFVGPHSNWNYFYAPVVPGETYRVCANAGQLAAIWYAASNAPNQEDSVRPKKVACSENGGIVRYIAEEFTIPEGATYLIINHSGEDKNLVIERKVPDPCQVVRVNDTLSINMMCVEDGTFVMGDDSSDNASPAHQVTLSDYYIGQTEVTQALWTAVMGTNPSKFSGNNLPVECVSWEDCQVFVQKLSDMTGLHFRLPTEAEWEFAARGGVKSRGYKYVGSDDVDSVAWYGVNSGQKTHSIAGKKPNELGIYDMSGNVWEWCQDWHEPYTAEAKENPQGAKEGEKPVIRGGCWHYNPMQCTPTYRYSYYDRTGSGSSTGFRIVLDIK